MEPNNNLLVELHRWAWRQDENFTTEAFAHLTRHLLAEEPVIGVELLEKVIGSARDIPPSDASSIGIRTQKPTEGHGIPDVRISGPAFLVLIEVKVGADVGLGQLEAYLEELQQSGEDFTQLVLLTPYLPVLSEELEERVNPVRWHEVAAWVESMLERNEVSEASSFLCSQFLGFLQSRRMVAAKVRSDVSAGLKKYFERVGEESIFRSVIQNLAIVAGEPELSDLVDLLMLIEQTLTSRKDLPKPRLYSGNKPSAWIGYNIESMKYFFFLYLSKPETLVFQRFKGGVDPASFDGKVGRIYEAYGKPRWCNEIDLAAPEIGFFSTDTGKVQQSQILESFLAESLEAARKLRPFVKPSE
jgi:hypothetical protein